MGQAKPTDQRSIASSCQTIQDLRNIIQFCILLFSERQQPHG